MVIQIVLIVAVLALLLYLLRTRGTAKASAGVKLFFVAFVAFAVYTVLRPEDLTTLAHWLGVGRGTDLMLYALVVAFAFATIGTYLRFRDVELRYARLARAIALQNAERPGVDNAATEQP